MLSTPRSFEAYVNPIAHAHVQSDLGLKKDHLAADDLLGLHVMDSRQQSLPRSCKRHVTKLAE